MMKNWVKFNLSKRELEILSLIAQGHTSKQIASKLNISLETVKDHRKSLLSKSSAKNCAELCFIAAKHNLVLNFPQKGD